MGKKSTTVGSEIVQSLRAFNTAVSSGQKITGRFTCSRVILRLEPREYDPALVKNVRRSLGISQALFAQFLGVSRSTVRSWEQGTNNVPGLAGRFMDEIVAAPEHWRKRLLESMVDKEVTAK